MRKPSKQGYKKNSGGVSHWLYVLLTLYGETPIFVPYDINLELNKNVLWNFVIIDDIENFAVAAWSEGVA